MLKDTATALQTAEYLLDIQAVKLSPEDYFTWASGWYSPIYCDNRLTLSYPEIRTFLAESMTKIIENNETKPDVIAGVATGAIAIGMLVAQMLGLPFVYVRPEAKKHGRKNQIEGSLPKNAKVVVIEDLISTGGSSLCAVEALREAGAEVLYMAAIMTYGFEVAEDNFSLADVRLITLCQYDVLIEKAVEKGYIHEHDIELLQEWRKSPSTWKK
ncbi:MAG: orotate phosphoribosyltransferase [Flavobacteriales bacterium]|nr:orotate phosphoribosyltransferase [Flavobacteriales bacterium]